MSKKPKVTISNIAKMLDVSAITVSRALSNQPGVSDELRQKIINKAQELGYRRNKCNDKKSILFLIRKRYLADASNFSYLVQGIETNVQDTGAEFILEFIDSEKQDEMILPYNLSRNKIFDGVILLGKFSDSYAYRIQQVVPNILILNGGSDTLDCNYVYFNYARIGYRSAEYLLERGHRQIGFVGMESSHSREQRLYGMSHALGKAGLSLEQDWLLNSREDLSGDIATLRENNNLPTAFVCQTDNVALKLIRVLHDQGLSVPDDISVIGSGNSDTASISIPALTTFDVNISHTCEIAVDTIFNQIKSEQKPCCTINVDAFLVERDSVQQLSEVIN